jgi:hypothetical protein
VILAASTPGRCPGYSSCSTASTSTRPRSR